jgi:hypothetical protein
MGSVMLSAPVVLGITLWWCVKNASQKTCAVVGTVFGVMIAGTALGGMLALGGKGYTDLVGGAAATAGSQLGGTPAAPAAPAPTAPPVVPAPLAPRPTTDVVTGR